MSKKKILINAFNMNCIGHINHGLWTHPRDTSTRFNTLEYWTELAQLLERGLFDGLFIADIVGVYDVYQQSVDVPLKESIQLPVNDPLLLVSAMAAVTKNLGFGLTANLTYEPPYLFARRMSTLDHLTRGRVGWNIVTGYLDSAAKAMGLTEQVEHDRRYDQAALRETNKLSVRLLMKADVNHEFVYARLRPEELVMWDALTFWSDLRMGGLEHCLEFHGSRAAQMLDALEAIGAVNARAGLQQACELFASGMPGADSETRRAEMRNIDKKHGGASHRRNHPPHASQGTQV